MFSVLSQLFITERHRQRAANVGFSLPALLEHDVQASVEPLLATNMRGTFLRTRVSRTGSVRSGFSECPIDKEPELLREFWNVLIKEGEQEGWDNTAPTVEEALEKLRKAGLTPKTLVVASDLDGAPEGLRVLKSELPGGALAAAEPEVTGIYTRVGDHVSIMAQRVNVALVVVP